VLYFVFERIGRERIAFMIRTDAPVRTDKFDYDEDEHLAIHEFESRHIFADLIGECTTRSGAKIRSIALKSPLSIAAPRCFRASGAGDRKAMAYFFHEQRQTETEKKKPKGGKLQAVGG